MPRRLMHSSVVGVSLALGVLYWFLAALLPSALLLQLLNGICIGAFVSVAIVYSRLAWAILVLEHPYNRAYQHAISVMLQWLVIVLMFSGSAWLQATGGAVDPTPSTFFSLLRYLAIVAGVLQVTAPGLEDGWWHGFDKITLYVSLTIGATVAIGLTLLQAWGSGSL